MAEEKINWSGKTNKDLETVFKTNIKKGLSRGKYAQAKEIYGENIIDPRILENRNFYGMEKKTFNFRAIFSRSAGILGVIYVVLLFTIELLGFDIKLTFYASAYLFLVVSALALFALSEYKYYKLYKTSRPRILVTRYGTRKKVSIESIVPGDIIMLSKGDIVPADAKIIESQNVLCLHKCKTSDGIYENIRQDKTHKVKRNYPPEFEPDILYASDIIESGYAVAVVFATGSNTLIMKKYKFIEYENHEQINSRNTAEVKNQKRSMSGTQENASKVSKAIFLLSLAFSVPAILFGIFEQRDYISVIMTCLTASAAAFSEQITIIVDFALTSGMSKSAGFGAVIKKTADIDKLNKMDMLIAKKSEISAHDVLHLEKICFADTDFEVSYENRFDIKYVLLNAATVCGSENAALMKAVCEAADSMEANYREIQKLGEIGYDKSTGIRSAAVVNRGLKLACFGEAEKIIERCSHQVIGGERFEPADIRTLEKKLLALYDKYDLVMAVASKELEHSQGSLDTFVTDLDFFAFFAFNEEKNLSVRKDINNLKSLGITPVMIADLSGVYTYKTAVNLGIVSEHEDYANAVINDNNINNIENADLNNIRIITRLSEQNNIKLIHTLKSRGKYAAITADSIKEAEILNESYLSFCHDNIKDEVLKNKASVNIKDMSLKLILKTLKNANLIYKNAHNAMIFFAGLFAVQYLLIFFATIFNGAYILNTAQIIWASVGAGFFCTVSIAANSEDIDKFKERKIAKNDRHYYQIIRKQGAMTALLIFLATILTFFICFALQGKNIFEYINSHENINSVHTAAFLACITACFVNSARYIKNIRRNKFFITAAVFNAILAGFAIAIKPVREYLGFGALDLKSICVVAVVGIAQVFIFTFRRND